MDMKNWWELDKVMCNKLCFEMTKGESECVLMDIYLGGVCLYVGIDMSV